MPWCPKCKTEYRDGFTVCSDCGTPLVDRLEPEEAAPQPVETEDLVLLTTIAHEQELELFTQLLHSSRIPFFTRDLELGSYMRIYMGFSVYGQEIYVRRRDYAICSQLLSLAGGEYDDAEVETAYEDYMAAQAAEPEDAAGAEEAEDSQSEGGGYRVLLGFLLFFGLLLLFGVLKTVFKF